MGSLLSVWCLLPFVQDMPHRCSGCVDPELLGRSLASAHSALSQWGTFVPLLFFVTTSTSMTHELPWDFLQNHHNCGLWSPHWPFPFCTEILWVPLVFVLLLHGNQRSSSDHTWFLCFKFGFERMYLQNSLIHWALFFFLTVFFFVLFFVCLNFEIGSP